MNKIQKEKDSYVIQARNLGVSFIPGYRSDDYKSQLFDFILRKKKPQNQDSFWPLRNINFAGYKGEILGIIGSNGSGKTTLCKLIAGILNPDEGKIKVDGKVSALFSFGLGFNQELSGRENVYLNGMMLGVKKNRITQYIEEIHDFSGIGQFFDEPIKHYSSGMKARLGFSVAAFLEPEILILDEALNTGDLEFSEKAAVKMQELVQKAKMVVIVTHSLSFAENNCDRLIWLDKGVIQAEGDPIAVSKAYQASIPPKKPKKRLNIKDTDLIIRDRAVIKAENVGVHYKVNKEKFWALRNIDFQINEGEVVGIIGHNGAGKSTLCKLLTHILTPDEGRLILNGKTTALLGFGAGFNPQLTGKDNVYLNGMLLGIPKDRIVEQYPAIVEFSELGKHMDKPVKQYSSGMKSRLGFSIAATLQPDIFIIDEALSTGDINFQQKASEKIQEMIKSAKAVIIVTHSMSFVRKVCTRAIWLKQGEIQFDGDPRLAVKQYRMDVRRKKAMKVR